MIVNLRDAELPHRDDEGHRFRRLFLGEPAGAERTGFAVYELAPGEKAWPYHYELSEEEWLFVMTASLSCGRRRATRRFGAGDIVCFPVGPRARIRCGTTRTSPVRFAMASAGTEGRAYVAIRPDSNTAYVEGPGFFQIVPLDVSMEYWEREP